MLQFVLTEVEFCIIQSSGPIGAKKFPKNGKVPPLAPDTL